MRVSDLEPPEVFQDGKTSQNHPQNIEKDDCGEGLFRGCPNQGNARDDGEDVEPPELLTEKQAGKDDGNLGRKTPSLNDIDPCPVVLGRHGLYCRNDFLKKHD
jgi:hypothetical protein